ncbi:g2838 [Coccomyxa viridis]|uniref:G2838 protein n=1 Tax=Coccomyxa viridis TaxID=1274662 RepID=A0ABP1FTB5_9CHLO
MYSSTSEEDRANRYSAEEERGRLLLVTTVDLGDGLTDKIELRAGDCPEEAAAAFCERNGLPETVIEPLRLHILENYRRAQLDTKQLAGTGGSSELGELMLSTDSVTPKDTEAAKEWPEEFILSTDSARDHGNDKENEAHRPQSAITVTETFPDGTSEPESEMSQAAEAGKAPDTAEEQASQGPYLYQPSESRSARVINRAGSPARSESSAFSRRSSLSGVSMGMGQVAVTNNRLYDNALAVQRKQDLRRMARDDEREQKTSMKRMNYVSAQLMKGRDRGAHKNYLHRLYAEGLEDLEKKRRQIGEARMREAEAELEGVTWQPQISRMAKALKRPGDEERWNYLARTAIHKNKERIEEAKREQEDAVERECTFAPVIDARSAGMMSHRSIVLKDRKITAHEQLYQDATRRQERQITYASWVPEDVTFVPKIIRRAPETGKVSGHPGRKSTGNLAERLHAAKDKAEARRRAALYAADHPIDPATGRPFFHPQTGRGPAARNKEGLPVGDWLYTKWAESEGRKAEQVNSSVAERNASASTKYTTNRSERLVEELKARRFRQIFTYLDQDGTGLLDVMALVTEDELDLMRTLDAEVRADVEAAARLLARQLQAQGGNSPGITSVDGLVSGSPAADLDITVDPSHVSKDGLPLIDADTFSKLLAEVVKRGRGHPRAYLLPSPVGKATDPEETFRPAVCPRSKALAQLKRSTETAWHDQLYSYAAVLSEKKDAKRLAHEQQQLDACTFKPEQLSAQTATKGRALLMSGVAAFDTPTSSSRFSVVAAMDDLDKYEDLEKEVRAVLETQSPSGSLMSHAATEQSVEALQSLSLGILPV